MSVLSGRHGYYNTSVYNLWRNIIMVHTYIMCHDFKATAGVYDENCEALEAAGVRYCDETEE